MHPQFKMEKKKGKKTTPCWEKKITQGKIFTKTSVSVSPTHLREPMAKAPMSFWSWQKSSSRLKRWEMLDEDVSEFGTKLLGLPLLAKVSIPQLLHQCTTDTLHPKPLSFQCHEIIWNCHFQYGGFSYTFYDKNILWLVTVNSIHFSLKQWMNTYTHTHALLQENINNEEGTTHLQKAHIVIT